MIRLNLPQSAQSTLSCSGGLQRSRRLNGSQRQIGRATLWRHKAIECQMVRSFVEKGRPLERHKNCVHRGLEVWFYAWQRLATIHVSLLFVD